MSCQGSSLTLNEAQQILHLENIHLQLEVKITAKYYAVIQRPSEGKCFHLLQPPHFAIKHYVHVLNLILNFTAKLLMARTAYLLWGFCS